MNILADTRRARREAAGPSRNDRDRLVRLSRLRSGWLLLPLWIASVLGALAAGCSGKGGTADMPICEDLFWNQCGSGCECPEGTECIVNGTGPGRFCRSDCLHGSDCPGGQVCVGYFSYATDPPELVNPRCAPPCADDSACHSGWECVDSYVDYETEAPTNICQIQATSPPPPSDAGTSSCGRCGSFGTHGSCCGGAYCAGECIGSPCC